jgi:FMN phosphatase YigB (HAD superfamily)
LLSNTNAHHWQVLVPTDAATARYPAIGRLHHHFASHLIGALKPDPATYAAVEEATGVRGHDVLFFDDLPDNVEGARRFGWRAIRIDPDGDPARQVLAALEAAGISSPGPGRELRHGEDRRRRQPAE